MEIIKNYLENMFIGLPGTEEVRKAKAELAAMMEDKYNELKASGKPDHEAIGIVISEFGSLEEILAELGLENSKEAGFKPESIKVSLEQAREYMEYCRSASLRIALGIFLCICSPIMLILITGMQEQGLLSIAEDQAAFAGLGILFVLVALGGCPDDPDRDEGNSLRIFKKGSFRFGKKGRSFCFGRRKQGSAGRSGSNHHWSRSVHSVCASPLCRIRFRSAGVSGNGSNRSCWTAIRVRGHWSVSIRLYRYSC